MESSPRTAITRSRKWTAGIMAMLLSAALILSACGGDTNGTVVDPPAGDVPVVPDEGEVEEVPETD